MAITTPVSFWNFNESSGDAADALGVNTLTNVGTTPYVTGLIGNAADIEATGGAMRFTHTDNVSLSITGDMSYGAFFKQETIAENAYGSKFGAAANRTWNFRSDSTTQIALFLLNSADSETEVRWTISAMSTAVWYHIIFTYIASTHTSELYINSVSQGTKDSVVTNLKDGTADLQVGACTAASASLDGLIDMCGIWNVALTAAEVSELYNAGAGNQYPFGTKKKFLPALGAG